jgi:hypothetical protein
VKGVRHKTGLLVGSVAALPFLAQGFQHGVLSLVIVRQSSRTPLF